MSKSQLQKRHYRAAPKRILGAAVALVVVFLLLASVVGLAEKYIAIRHRVRDLTAEQAALIQKQSSLKATNQYIETQEGEERELRTKYNVIKPGEGVVVITEPPAAHEVVGPKTRVGRWWDSLLRGLGIRKD